MAGLNKQVPYPSVLIAASQESTFVLPLEVVILMLRGSGVSIVHLLNSLACSKVVQWYDFSFSLPVFGPTMYEATLTELTLTSSIAMHTATLEMPPDVLSGLEERQLAFAEGGTT